MTLKIVGLINIIISAIVGGMYWGPWLALTRSLKKFETKVFLQVVSHLNENMAFLMTILSPLSSLTTILVLIISFNNSTSTFYFTLVGFGLFLIALIVTVTVEVPIVKQIVTWTETTLPTDWERLRDRWGKFHIIRVVAGYRWTDFSFSRNNFLTYLQQIKAEHIKCLRSQFSIHLSLSLHALELTVIKCQFEQS